jgi:cytochrome c oxidase subunit IV
MSLHVISPKTYVWIFLALMVGTALTVAAAFVDLGAMTGFTALNDIVMLAIAVAKAVLVILFFMHVRYSGRLTSLTVASGFVFLAILMAIVVLDYASRGVIPGK